MFIGNRIKITSDDSVEAVTTIGSHITCGLLVLSPTDEFIMKVVCYNSVRSPLTKEGDYHEKCGVRVVF